MKCIAISLCNWLSKIFEIMNPVTQDKEQDKVLSIIRSCITSAKENLTLEQLHRDYKQLVGSPVPFRKFQHGTLASFLQSVPKVINVYNRGGQLYVKAVSSDQTSHLESLIRGQKKSKSKGCFSKPNPIRKPYKSSWIPPSYSHRPHYGVIQKNPPLMPTPPKSPLLPLPMTYNHPKPNGNVKPPLQYNKTPKKSPSPPLASGNEFYFPNLPRPTLNSNKLPPKTPLPPMKMERPKSPTVTSFKQELEKVAKRKGIYNVLFTTIPCGKKNNYWLSQLKVGDQKFSSYPEEMKTPMEAEEEVARKALDSLKGILKPFKIPETASFEIGFQRVKQLLTNQPVWWQHVRELYIKQYQESIPEVWVKQASENGIQGIDFNQPTNGNWILSLSKQARPRSKSNSLEPSNFIIQAQASLQQPQALKFPEEKMWNVFVTYFKDCSEIWFRLIGEEYSDAFENLVTDMELYYMEESKLSPVAKPSIGSYYACSHEESWFRVQLRSIKDDNASVFFVDHGDNETLSASNLFQLDTKFLQLPSQSIKASLAGFKGRFNAPSVLSAAQSLALGKTLVAEVHSRKDPLSVILYDTSTADDININEQLFKVLPEAYPVPAFPTEGGVCEVYVSHVTSTGDIYVRIESASFKILETLLVTARKRAAEILGDDENLSIDMGKLYLAKFSPDGDWHRAAPRTLLRDSQGKVFLKALDLGIHSRVASANIVPLDISDSLCKIPPQSLLCRIYNVPSSLNLRWTDKASERLISLFPKRDEPLLLKVIKEGKDDQPTLVELFQRVQPQNMLVSINATLDMDSTLFRPPSNNEDKNNNLHCQENGATFANSNSPKETELEFPSSLVGEALALQKLNHPDLPDINSYFDVFVTYAASPSHFAVQSWRTTMKLEWLMGEMKSFYSDESRWKPVGKVLQGGFYALTHTDSSWYRVRIDQTSDELVSGVFVDYGDCFCSTTDKLQPLWTSFKVLPYQAFKAKLGGILPNNMDWMPEDCCRFRQLVENIAFVSVATRILPGDAQEPPTLLLRLIDTGDPTIDLYIDDILIKEGRARRYKEIEN